MNRPSPRSGAPARLAMPSAPGAALSQDMTADDRRRMVRWLLTQALDSDAATRWRYLQAAHVAGQTQLGLHGVVHVQMLRQAWRDHDIAEAWGQLMRLALVPLGHLTGRIPLGNSGRSDVSAFLPMAMSPEMAALLRQARESTKTHKP